MYGPYTSVKQINRPWVQPLTCHKNYPRPSLLLAGSEALALRELSPLRTPPENTGEEPIVCLHGEDVGVWVGSLPNCQGMRYSCLGAAVSAKETLKVANRATLNRLNSLQVIMHG